MLTKILQINVCNYYLIIFLISEYTILEYWTLNAIIQYLRTNQAKNIYTLNI